MNILHLKYAVEIAKTKSISKAAENLFMSQPNLSRAIKELEDSLGIVIFKRTSKGISITDEGEEFLQYARRIVFQINEVEEIYQNGRKHRQQFSVCVPRASYFSSAFTAFAKHIRTDNPAEIFYKETNSMRTIDCLLRGEFNLGIIRYQTGFDRYYKNFFLEKGLTAETLTEFSYVLLLSEHSPLARKEQIEPSDLSDYIEITHGDPYVPTLPLIDVKKAELSEYVDKRIYVFERASQFALLQEVPNTFMWVSPVGEEVLHQHGLIRKECSASKKRYKDVLVYRKGYRLTELDKLFIRQVTVEKNKWMEADK